jgi:hypothetical protein
MSKQAKLQTVCKNIPLKKLHTNRLAKMVSILFQRQEFPRQLGNGKYDK